MFFWNSLAFLMIQWMLAIWSLVPLPFLKPACTSGSSRFMYCWGLVWTILSITLLACEMSVVVWAFFGISFLWDWNENLSFPVLCPLLSFPNLLAYWEQHFHSIIIPELTQTPIHWVGDAIQPSHALSSPSPPTFNLSQHQGLFQMSQFFASGGQSIGASASASVLPMNIQDWFLLGWTGWISLLSKGLSRVFSNPTAQKHQFFGPQLSL